ncbi:MAG: flagellar motor protein MotB, partial [Vicinamibacterales bacterium]
GSFSVGSTDLSEAARAILDDLGAALMDVGNKVLVEGHTDDVPIRTARFASNWELSTARATTVIAYLLEHFAIRPERLSAAGYAEFHPRVPNASAENRARNRRVDIVILRPSPPAPIAASRAKTP